MIPQNRTALESIQNECIRHISHPQRDCCLLWVQYGIVDKKGMREQLKQPRHTLQPGRRRIRVLKPFGHRRVHYLGRGALR